MREECTPTLHPPLPFPSRGAGMEAPLWKATKTPGIRSLCFSSHFLPPHSLLFFLSFTWVLFAVVEYTVRCGRSLSRRPWQAKLGPQIRAVLGCCEGHESTNITPLSKRTLGPTTGSLCYCGSYTTGQSTERECNSYGWLITKSNPRPYGTAYSWNWEHVNSVLFFSHFHLFCLFQEFDSKLFISAIMKGHFRIVSVPDGYPCCLFDCDKPDQSFMLTICLRY